MLQKGGYLIPPRETTALSESLIRLAENKPLRNRLGTEGQKRFTDQFRHETMTRQIREIYLQTLNQSRS